jgi:3-oxoadipate enol-lactonase/4-carboxymuconolactone decarboxylase
MAFTDTGGVRIHWRRDGRRGGTPLVLLNSIGTDLRLWDAAIPWLADHDLLRIDTRGHGGSDDPNGDYTLEMLAADVIAVMDDAGFGSAAIAGVSLGGMIAMQIALDHPERVAALIPVCTSAEMDEAAWTDRVATVRREGTGAIAAAAMGRFLSRDFRVAYPTLSDRIEADLRAMSDRGYAGAGAAIRDMRLIGRLPAIAVPTLVIAGGADISTPFVGHGDRIVAAVHEARYLILPCAHLAPVEAPEGLGNAINALTG